MLEFYFVAEYEGRYEATEVRGTGCRHDCPGFLMHKMDHSTLTETANYTLEYPRIVNNRISDHHVSYEPEVTVPVCDKCHGEIHSDNGKYGAFEPDMKRKEWEG